jgi:hypothetical protein
MTGFMIINVIGRLVVTALVIVEVALFRERNNMFERLGMGLMGGGSFLTVPVILYPQNTPFDGWSTSILTWGVICFLGGGLYRRWKHKRANDQAVSQSKQYLESRGKS